MIDCVILSSLGRNHLTSVIWNGLTKKNFRTRFTILDIGYEFYDKGSHGLVESVKIVIFY